ncbi:MAG: hypothetical protein ACOCVR_05075, partial [Myxococcota bacterium]
SADEVFLPLDPQADAMEMRAAASRVVFMMEAAEEAREEELVAARPTESGLAPVPNSSAGHTEEPAVATRAPQPLKPVPWSEDLVPWGAR